MGLDAVELVMAVEEKFGIGITDEEASRIRTVGDLKRLVRAKLEIADGASCLTQRAFHLIRKSAISEFGISRHRVKPDTSLESFIPQSARRGNWEHFQLVLGVAHLPELVRPYSVNLTITLLVLSSVLVLVWYGALHPAHFGRWVLFGAVVASALGWASARFTKPMKTKFKAGYDKVQDLARFLVARYPQVVGKPATAKWTEEEISCSLREVIVEQLGVSKFDENSRFVKDLHID